MELRERRAVAGEDSKYGTSRAASLSYPVASLLKASSRHGPPISSLAPNSTPIAPPRARRSSTAISVARAVWLFRNRLKGERHETSAGIAGLDLVKRPRFGFGALCILLYVGAEASIGSLIVNYLMQPGVLALDEQSVGKLIGIYWSAASSPRPCFVSGAWERR